MIRKYETTEESETLVGQETKDMRSNHLKRKQRKWIHEGNTKWTPKSSMKMTEQGEKRRQWHTNVWVSSTALQKSVSSEEVAARSHSRAASSSPSELGLWGRTSDKRKWFARRQRLQYFLNRPFTGLTFEWTCGMAIIVTAGVFMLSNFLLVFVLAANQKFNKTNHAHYFLAGNDAVKASESTWLPTPTNGQRVP